MHIREIEIDNFKSFANKVTIPFLEGFTTISGPNGSGKSNIIDSVLFALGLSSSRTLRAEKLYHLISTHTKRNEAQVKITFAHDDNNEAMVVTRRVKKSSQGFTSTYYLNGKTTTLTDIHDNLAKYNISPGNYNVIMQGDVTGITNTTGNERRKILDEIAGVADFDKRIEQATKELETVEGRVERSNIILAEIDTRLEQLKEERETALKYQELKNKKTELESKLSKVKYFDIKTSIERLHESILDANKDKKNEEQNLKKLNIKLEEVKEKFVEISELVKTKGEAEQIEIKKHVESLKGTIARKKDAINFADKQISENETASKNSTINIEKLLEKIDDTKLKIEAKKDEIKIIEKNIEQEKVELQKVLDEVSSINQSADKNIEKRNDLRKELEATKDAENNLIKEKLPLEEKLARRKNELKQAKEGIEELTEKSKERAEKKELLEIQTTELEKELKDFEIQQKNVLHELDKIKGEINDSAFNIQSAYRKISTLEAQKQAAQDANFGRAIDTIMNAGIAGIHAPLAKLGKVDKEYSTALEIAMGGRMRNIVVDSDEVGRVAIEVLKTSRAGRATFLPLNKIRARNFNLNLPKGDGIIDFAINLIDFDKKYNDAFSLALGDTLIVEDLEVARKLTGKYRMVTLDGSLVEKTGSMTGGSVQKSGLKFSQNEDEELNEFKKRLKGYEESHKSLEAKKLELEQKQDKIRSEYSSIMTEVNKNGLELDNIKKSIYNTKESLENKKKIVEEYTPEISTIEKELEKLEEKHIKFSEKIAKLSGDIEEVDKTIPKDELSRLNELTENVEFEIKRNESKIANCNNEIKGFEMEIEFNHQSIEAQKEAVEKLKSDNEKLAVDKETYSKEIEEVEKQLIELNKKIEEIGSKLVELQKERDEANFEVLENEKNKNLLETKIERVTEQIEAYKTRRKELEPELSEIREELKEQGIDISKLVPEEISTEDVVKNINRLQRRMEDMEPVNMKALTDFDEVTMRKEELKEKLDTLSSEKAQILERMQGYEDLKKQSFLETFNNINNNFKDIFEKLSDGEGELILEKPEDPLAGGLTIEAQPRDKKKQRLESMSGGEKSLTALAFVFAIQRYMPAPFYAFDEVDMHLDGINVEKLSEMIKHQAKTTQFVVVSLRKPMIESADRTVGVTQKDKGITKVTGVKLSD